MLTEIHSGDIVNLVHGREVIILANVELLKKKMEESGMTVSAIADKSGILRETLYNRMKTGNFYASEIVSLTRVLRLTRKERDEIFLP
ncbi:hypothetical protein BACPEC_01180 [[Bacteroides] pectinophilus ATCC 43243]|uniref:HTH cro/C1-type domain-containing protein n=1 Tax=[Bacteroides] pectinophilus ATCC 43243 TaxID=483218 RepID=B7AR70_9FIRM|nr:hypothetical protein BACPEC_01180 [[Bacteroides] pectinophilus ATCC 43243]DAI89198.1 MAG TPA: Putative TetR-family transcriptional regulator [Caudoviricetes sp.]